MKHCLLLFSFCIISLLSFGQQADIALYKPVIIPYNSKWEVTKPEAAVYRRLAYFPDSLRNIEDLEQPQFNYAVTDYYADGTVKAKGHYKNGQKWAIWSFYYPNGQLNCKGRYDDWMIVGTWEFWWPDGKQMLVTDYEGFDRKLRSFWNQEGEQTVKNGNGIYTEITLDENGIQMVMQGPYKDGIQVGEWTYGPEGEDPLVRQTFDEQGKLLQGVVYEKGRVKEKYNYGNKLRVEPEPESQERPEWWYPDPTFYEKDYPVVADVFKFEVQKVAVDKKLKTNSKHYYNVIQRYEGGADTVGFGMPVVLPVFKRVLQSYLNTHLKFPEHLRTQNIQGRIEASFLVDAQGAIKSPSIVKSLEPALDKAVLDMLAKMPAWKPGTQNGKPVDVRLILPINVKGQSFVAEQEGYKNNFSGRRNI